MSSHDNDPFYLRYYTGHSGKHGHEFLEFEYSHGRLRYANNSNYRNDSLIRKEMWVGPLVVKELKRIVESSEILKEDDTNWPKKNIVGKQELEIRVDNDHIAFETAKIGSLVDIQDNEDPEGLRAFYYLVQDLKCLIFSLISLHFKRPLPHSVTSTSGLSCSSTRFPHHHIAIGWLQQVEIDHVTSSSQLIDSCTFRGLASPMVITAGGSGFVGKQAYVVTDNTADTQIKIGFSVFKYQTVVTGKATPILEYKRDKHESTVVPWVTTYIYRTEDGGDHDDHDTTLVVTVVKNYK